MKCLNDDTVLVMSERQGIEIDYCPTCRGVWLDRGELDKIIERSGEQTAPKYEPRLAEQKQDPQYQKKKKRESFLSDLFEF